MDKVMVDHMMMGTRGWSQITVVLKVGEKLLKTTWISSFRLMTKSFKYTFCFFPYFLPIMWVNILGMWYNVKNLFDL